MGLEPAERRGDNNGERGEGAERRSWPVRIEREHNMFARVVPGASIERI